ncbi:hypothetical protein H5410_026432 [Solanum commersonii]|uniref:Uncharacterized protein n=1 Tax=Solanum commersonii TaxID=4109 RepID=A0A9J5Z0Q2_SOLCO|nr:hypothetical protein H5410_026432 [Solanum commersonii]
MGYAFSGDHFTLKVGPFGRQGQPAYLRILNHQKIHGLCIQKLAKWRVCLLWGSFYLENGRFGLQDQLAP